jgi:hypothetical protein
VEFRQKSDSFGFGNLRLNLIHSFYDVSDIEPARILPELALFDLSRVQEVLDYEHHHFSRRVLYLDRNLVRIDEIFETVIKLSFVSKDLGEFIAADEGFDLDYYGFLSFNLSRYRIQRISNLVIDMGVNSFENSIVLLGLAVVD